jgi:phenylalanyl-tRNA synthetase beta chain
MKFTLSWLKEHLETDATLQEVADKLTMVGLEVERIEDKAAALAPFTTARVVSAEKHPDADRLRVLMVDAGDGKPVQVVCGAPNARAGLVGVFARPGTHIPGTGIDLRVGKIRGQESHGMMVSAREMGISDEHEGIIELSAETKLGQPFAPLMGLDDPMIEIAVTPNRADCLGVRGIARDLAASMIGKLKEDRLQPVKGEFPCPVSVKIEDTALCPAFALRLVRGVKNGPSPDWLQRRLRAIGLRPINALVDITNLLTFDRGRPLHVFDAAKVNGNLVVRRAQKGEKLLALDGKTYEFDNDACVIADDAGVESLAGIMGGEASGVVESGQYRADRSQARHPFRRTLPLRARRRSSLHRAGAGACDQTRARALRRQSFRNRARGRDPGIEPGDRLPAFRAASARRLRGKTR